VHNQFLANDGEYVRGFTQLVQQELNLLSSNSSPQALEQLNQVFQTLERSMDQFHQHQAETLHVHEQYLRSQAELTEQVLQFFQTSTAQIASTAQPAKPKPVAAAFNPVLSAVPSGIPSHNGHSPLPKPAEPSVNKVKEMTPASQHATTQAPVSLDVEGLKKALLELVSEKTGYPPEMLELGMDMEADLGIDSIKRVEIMGAIQTRFPSLPQIDPTALAEFRTLGQIVDYITAAPQQPAAATEADSKAAVESTPAPVPSSNSIEGITQDFLKVVSEKTGYPVEMLELDMELEADLGIDSIKRVEILGAMQANYPELAKIDPANLAELRTLRQIIESLAAPTSSGVPPREAGPAMPEPVEEKTLDLPRGVVMLKSLPEPDHLEVPVAKGHICLVMDDGTDLTPALTDKLAGEGKDVVVLRLPESLVAQRPLPAHVRCAQLSDWSEAGIQSTLNTLQKEYGPVAVFIHMDLMASASDDHSEREEIIVETIFLIAKLLKATLNTASQEGFAAFMTVTHLDGELGLASSGNVEPLSGAFFGLVKTLNLEWDNVFCRAVDLEPGMDVQTAASLIMAEMHDPNRLISEIGYHSGERATLAVERPTTAGLSKMEA
jgi:acyl carrier protein